MAESDGFQTQRLRRALIQRLESLSQAGVTVVGRMPPVAAAGPDGPPPGSSGQSPSAERPVAGVAEEAVGAIDPAVAANRQQTIAARTAPPASESPQTEQPMAKKSASGAARSAAETPPSLFDQAPAGPELSLEERRQSLQALCQEVAACTRCAELVAYRTQTVFGVGNPQARLCFFGEAPGADEDRQGEPFVGRAGQLLSKIIEACGMRREDVYIMNVLKCRPPNNRDPAVEEISNCRGFFERQMDILRPEFICCLGKPAMASLLGTPPSMSLGRMRGRFHRYRTSQVLVTYHPAYLLRNPPAKRDTWEDMQLLMREMGIEIPKR